MGDPSTSSDGLRQTQEEILQTKVFEDPGVQINRAPQREDDAPERGTGDSDGSSKGREPGAAAADASDASLSSGQLAKLAIKKMRVEPAKNAFHVPEIVEIQADVSQDLRLREGLERSSSESSELLDVAAEPDFRREGEHLVFQGKCDPKGRVRIAASVLRELGLGAGDVVEVWIKKSTY